MHHERQQLGKRRAGKQRRECGYRNAYHTGKAGGSPYGNHRRLAVAAVALRGGVSNLRRLASQCLASLVPPHNQRGQATGTRYRAPLSLSRGACRER